MRTGMFVCAMAAIYSMAVGSERAPAQQPWGVVQLMAELARVRSASGQFTERKTMHTLTEPLVLSGRLVYVAPNHIEKITVLPTQEKLVMDGEQVTIVSGSNNETYKFSVTQYPQIGGLVEGIRATLAGDLGTLEHFYTLKLSGTVTAWDLHLIPHDGNLMRFVRWIEFRGSGDRIQTITTEGSDGDRSDIAINEDRRDVR